MQEIGNSYKVADHISKNIFFPKRNITTKKSLSLKYLKYRALRPILKLYYKIFKLININTPWTSQASIIIFEKILNKNMIGLEYGSGKSTLYFASKLKNLLSVEHAKDWYENIKVLLESKNIKNVDYRLVEKNKPCSGNTSIEIQNKLKLPKFHIRKDYEAYYNVVNEFPEQHFDFILVDGRARVECAINCIGKLKRNGILVLDNAERERYSPVIKILDEWPRVVTTNGLTDTIFWFKP
ncbi:MAG: hypothetical protein M3512_13905 [Bacteroidota bacterium]|nr:hypothetical protein [Bacteroidota bacterium]